MFPKPIPSTAPALFGEALIVSGGAQGSGFRVCGFRRAFCLELGWLSRYRACRYSKGLCQDPQLP